MFKPSYLLLMEHSIESVTEHGVTFLVFRPTDTAFSHSQNSPYRNSLSKTTILVSPGLTDQKGGSSFYESETPSMTKVHFCS